MDASATVRSSRKRPRNRKELILRAAGELFLRHGYHVTSLGDVAAEVGISSTAIYRHFRNKEDLLVHVLFEGLDLVETRLVTLPEAARTVDGVAGMLAGLALDWRGVPALWQREVRTLGDGDRREVLRRLTTVAAALGALTRLARPELRRAEADFLSWCALSVLGSPSYHTVRLPRPGFDRLLTRMVTAALDAPPGQPGPGPPALDHGSNGTGRRERLLTEASRLFHRHGYPAVGIEDIGVAAGITGPSVYHHFASKSELLVAILARAARWSRHYTARALAEAADPADALERLLRYYAAVTLRHPDLIGTLVSEFIHLPPERASELRGEQRAGIDEWIRLLRQVRPALGADEARAVVQAVIMIVNDVTRLSPLRTRPSVAADLVAVGRAVLFTE